MSSDYRKFYYCYGIPLNRRGDQLTGDCPFCYKDDHFFVSPKTGQYCCHVCGEEGNSYTFLKRLHETSSEPNYEYLTDYRGILGSTFADAGIKETVDGTLLLPTRNEKGSLTNLYRIEEYEKDDEVKFKILSGPSPLKQQLYRRETITKQHDTVYIVEGHWDALALVETFATLQQRNVDGREIIVEKGIQNYNGNMLVENAVVAVPGATTFDDKWIRYLSGKDIVLIFDNDTAGERGRAKLLRRLSQSQVSLGKIQILSWKEDDHDYNDLRDVFLDNETYRGVLSFMQERLEDIDLDNDVDLAEDGIEDIEPIPCHTFNELLTHYKKELYLTDAIEATLAVMLAVILSTRAPGGQLGLRVIGTPGSAKSTLAEAMSYCKSIVYPRSKFTGLISGWGRLTIENQVASKVHGKCIIIKDADTMMQLPNLAQVESEIRDALGDGSIRAEFKNGKVMMINSVFTMILCGTKALRQMDNSLLGARFMDISIHDKNSPTDKIVKFAIKSQFDTLCSSFSGGNTNSTRKKGIDTIAPPTIGFLLEKLETMQQSGMRLNNYSEKTGEKIQALADYITLCRSKVKREKSDHIAFRPEAELATRIAELLLRLAAFLALVFLPENRTKVSITKKVMEHLQRVVKDTSYGFVQEIIIALATSKHPLSRDQLATRIKLSQSQTFYVLRDMQELGMVRKKTATNVNGRGRPTNYWELTPKMLKIRKLAFS